MIDFVVRAREAHRLAGNLRAGDADMMRLTVLEEPCRLPILQVFDAKGALLGELFAYRYSETLQPLERGDVITEGSMLCGQLRAILMARPRMRKSGRVGAILAMQLDL